MSAYCSPSSLAPPTRPDDNTRQPCRVAGRDPGGEPRRVVERQHHDRGAEPDLAGQRGAMRDHHQGRGAQAIIREMMLGEPGGLVAELVGEPGLLGDLGEDLRRRFLGLARPPPIADPEFHDPSSAPPATVPRGGSWLSTYSP